jgi:uncharacterized membrane protein YfcA
MDWTFYPIILVAGFFAGIINTIAGSGSLITLPLLIFLGLPPGVANGTNRVGILLQNVVGSASYQKQGVLDSRGAAWLSLPAIVGAIIGAQIAVDLDEEMLRSSIGAVMVLMLIVVLMRPERWLNGVFERMEGRPDWKAHVSMFVVGIYGGFIQAGVGAFLLGALVLVVGYDLVRANAVKVLIVLIFTAFALAVFVRNGQVNWGVGLVLASGNILGAWIAARLAVEKGAAWVRRILIGTIAIAAIYMLR